MQFVRPYAGDGSQARDLAKAVRKQGFRFGVSNHRMEHFTFIPVDPQIPSGLTDPA